MRNWSIGLRASTVKPVLTCAKPVYNGLSKIDKTKILITIGSLMKVERIVLQIAPLGEWSFYTGFTVYRERKKDLRLVICALWSPAGKGLTSWLSFVVSTVSWSLSHWYPGSGVVLDCIDS